MTRGIVIRAQSEENSMTIHRQAVLRGLTVGAVSLGLVALAPTGIAHAWNARCDTENGPENLGPSIFDVREFSFQDIGNGKHLVTVEVMAAMPQSDAQKFIDIPGDEATFRLWGDDPDSDDFIEDWHPQTVWAAPEGLGLRGSAEVWTVNLNEDSGFDPAAGDELYTGIRLIRNGNEHKAETCLMSHNF
jgi:hypothetical protein